MVIGLTGGIGSGKSTVSDYIKGKGYTILDADKISREIVYPGGPCIKALEKAFGSGIILADGNLDRKGLGAIVFSDENEKAKLDDIMLGAIVDEIVKGIDKCQQRDEKLIFVDAPLLFEAGLNRYVEEIWLVHVDLDERVSRVMARDGFTREEVMDRINKQMPEEEKEKRSQVIIDNTGSLDNLYSQIEGLLERYE